MTWRKEKEERETARKYNCRQSVALKNRLLPTAIYHCIACVCNCLICTNKTPMRPWYVAAVLQFRGCFSIWPLQKILINLQSLPDYPISFPIEPPRFSALQPIEEKNGGFEPPRFSALPPIEEKDGGLTSYSVNHSSAGQRGRRRGQA
jgi:hypothetical protein